MKILENTTQKACRSKDYNFNFDKQTGFFARWGATLESDPDFSPFGPEIADIEIVVNGCPKGKSGKICNFCYKGNNAGKPEWMTLDTFKRLFHNLPKTVTQIAFGITSVNANPDTLPIMKFCRENGVIPNVTISGRDNLTDEQIKELVSVLGACAFSIYQEDKDQCYNLIERFAKAGLKQQNIHYMIASESIDFAYEILKDIKSDKRLYNINAIVFLSLKQKNRGVGFTPLSPEKFNELITAASELGISYGMDSCTAGKFIKSKFVEVHPNKAQLLQMVEGCESTRMSMYSNHRGEFFPCSFMDGENVENGGDWTTGLDLINCKNFLKDIWFNEKTVQFRNKCIGCTSNNGGCPHYNI